MRNWMIAFLAGAAAGTLSGLGLGGGSLLLIWLTSATGFSQIEAQGINLLFFLPAAAMALPAHKKHHVIKKAALLPAITAGLAAAALAAWAATEINTVWLHRLFGAFLLFTGVRELLSRR